MTDEFIGWRDAPENQVTMHCESCHKELPMGILNPTTTGLFVCPACEREFEMEERQ